MISNSFIHDDTIISVIANHFESNRNELGGK